MKEKNPKLVKISVLTVITVFSWVTLEIYRNIKKEPPLIVPEEITAPLDPKLDTSILFSLKEKLSVDESQLPLIINEPSISPTASATVRATASPGPVATESATPSASISPSPTSL